MPDRNKVKRRKGAGSIPLPADQANIFNQQAQSIVGQRNDLIGTLRTQRSQILSDFGVARSSINRALDAGLADTVNAGIERGILGSSADFKDRIAVRANSAAQLADAMSARNQALLANKAQILAANRDAEMGLLNLQSARAAAKSTQFAQELLVNGLMTPDIGGGFGFGGGGGAGPNATKSERKLHQGMEKQSDAIQGLARAWAMAHSSEKAALMRRLQARWRLRNKLRAKAGLAPFSSGRLDQLIARMNQQYNTPGAIGGGRV